jgi:hypothetical protein
MLRSEAERRGLLDAKPLYAMALVDEQPWVNELLRLVWGVTAHQWEAVEIPRQQIVLGTAMTMGEEYRRAIAKVAFHFVLKIFPELSGNEPEFRAIREYVWDGSGAGSGRPIHQRSRQFVDDFERGMRPTHWMHVLGAERSYGRVVAYAQFFAGSRFMPLPYEIRIGRNPARVALPPERRVRLFVQTNDPDAKGLDGLMEDPSVTQFIKPVGRVALRR